MEDTHRGKPDPEVFLNAAAKLQARPEHCVVFEDAVAGVQAAKAGGIKCVAVQFVGHHFEESLRGLAHLVTPLLEKVGVDQVLGLLSPK